MSKVNKTSIRQLHYRKNRSPKKQNDISVSDRVASLSLRLSQRYTNQIVQVNSPTIISTDEENQISDWRV